MASLTLKVAGLVLFAQAARLSLTRNGHVRYELKTPWRNGTDFKEGVTRTAV